MNNRKTAVVSILAVLGLSLALAAGPAQDKARDKARTCREAKPAKTVVHCDEDSLSRGIEQALRCLDALEGLNVRIRGPKTFRLDLNLSGLETMVRELSEWGRKMERRYGRDDWNEHRRLTRDEKRELRKALRALRDLDIDIDIDFD